MSSEFPFDDIEKALIERMYKKRMLARSIAKLLDKSPADVSNYINAKLVKRAKPPTIIGKQKPVMVNELVENVKLNRVTGGLRHYNDPLAAKEGSRKLLEAIHKYFEKREGKAA